VGTDQSVSSGSGNSSRDGFMADIQELERAEYEPQNENEVRLAHDKGEATESGS
jgi:hypothetical protein